MKRKPPKPKKKTRVLRFPTTRPAPPARDLAPADAEKRRETLVALLCERRSGVEICNAMGLTAWEFNRLLKETPGLQEEVNGLMAAAALAERGANFGTRVEIRDTKKADPHARLKACDALDAEAGVQRVKVDGIPTVVIMGEQINVGVAAPVELETLLLAAARKVGDTNLMKHVEAKVSGRETTNTEDPKDAR